MNEEKINTKNGYTFKKPEFEPFKAKWPLIDKMHAKYDCKPDMIIEKGIPWDKVKWIGTYDNEKSTIEKLKNGTEIVRSVYDFYPVIRRKNEKGETEFFYLKDNAEIKTNKRALAWSCDLYDADGKVLSIMLQAC